MQTERGPEGKKFKNGQLVQVVTDEGKIITDCSVFYDVDGVYVIKSYPKVNEYETLDRGYVRKLTEAELVEMQKVKSE